MAIYIRAGTEIYRKRQKMLNFSSTGGTVTGNEPFSPINEFSSAFNYKTTEVTQTTEIIQAPRPTAKSGSGHNVAYSVTISSDVQAANQLNTRASLEEIDMNDASTGTLTLTNAPSDATTTNIITNVPTTTTQTTTTTTTTPTPNTKRARILSAQISIAPTVTATITTNHPPGTSHGQNNRRRNYYESHNATWSYTKCAILFFSVLLITWIPSSGNRVYSMINGGDVSRPLFFASAFVLPLQGFWNAIIYMVTSWAACRSLWGYCVAGVG